MFNDELQSVVCIRQIRSQLRIAAFGGGKLAAKLRCELDVAVVQLSKTHCLRFDNIWRNDRIRFSHAATCNPQNAEAEKAAAV